MRFCAAFRIVRRLKYDGGGIEWKAGTDDIIAIAIIFIFYIQFYISFSCQLKKIKNFKIGRMKTLKVSRQLRLDLHSLSGIFQVTMAVTTHKDILATW